jgi:uncharacterized protein (TIGR00288 family)
MKYTILIDGGFIKPLFRKSNKRRIQATDVLSFADKVGRKHANGFNLLRVYYYDSPPLDSTVKKPISNTPQDFKKSEVYTHQHTLFRELKQSDFISVREGVLAFRGWKLKRNTLKRLQEGSLTHSQVDDSWFEANIQQKGVDTKLGLDMAWITFNTIVDRVIVVMGDSDFVPAIKAARRNGIKVILCSLNHGISNDLRTNVDVLDPSPINSF